MVALPDNLAERNAPGNLARGVVDFHPWQRRWFADRARVKVIRAHRQTGKDFLAAAEAVDDAFRTGADWYIVSMTQRQADATFAKARRIAEVFRRVLKKRGEVVLSDEAYREYDAEIDQWFDHRSRTLRLPGGGSVTALPGRDPDTLAGLTGSVIFTEFGLFGGGGYNHWRVVFPLITLGYRLIVISTPRGKNTKFYELCSDPGTYSVHTQTILDSVAEGFVLYDNEGRPTTVEAFRRLYGDEAGWQREYMCEFTGDLESLVKWAQLEAAGLRGTDGAFECLVLRDGAGWRPDFFRGLAPARLELGWDVARHRHLSVLWANRVDPGGLRQLARLVLMHECEFALQRSVVRAGMDSGGPCAGCGDATGLGMDSNETLRSLYGPRWDPVTFTESAKRELGSLLRTAYGDGMQGLPRIDGEYKFIHTDIYAIETEAGADRLKLVEGDNPLLPESHCDVAYAGALALKAQRLASVKNDLILV